MLLAGWSEIHRDPKDDEKGPADPKRLRAFMKAHSIH
jgi:hypothetical protein